MRKLNKNLGLEFSPVWFGFLFLPFFVAGCFAEPIADDYAYAYRTLSRTFGEAWLREYLSWNGRYASNGLVLLVDTTLEHRWIYHISPVVIIAGLIFSVNFVLRALLQQGSALLISITIVLLYCGSLVRISEAIYWYTGSMSYTTGLILNVMVIGALLRYGFKQEMRWLLLGIFSIVIGSGMNEVSMALNLVITMIYAEKRQKGWLIFLLFAAIAAALVVLAPGNDVRSGLFPEKYDFLNSFGMSVLQTIRFTGHTLAYLPLVIAMVFIWSKGCTLIAKNRKGNVLALLENRLDVSGYLLVLFPFIALFVSAFLPYFATGILGQHRTVSLGQFFLIPFFLGCAAYLGKRKNGRFTPLRSFFQKIPTRVYAFVFLVTFLTLGNSGRISRGLVTGELSKQQEQLQDRESKVRSATADTLLYFTPLDTTVLFVIDIDKNPGYWINKHQVSVINDSGDIRISRRKSSQFTKGR